MSVLFRGKNTPDSLPDALVLESVLQQRVNLLQKYVAVCAHAHENKQLEVKILSQMATKS